MRDWSRRVGDRPLLGQRAFDELRKMFERASGIVLSADKRSMIEARLTKRIQTLGLDDFDAYCEFLRNDVAGLERQLAIDLLTTNETYFFREPEHFEQLGALVTTRFATRSLRLWSAACSTGEEPYSIAMVMLDRRPELSWEIFATDLSLSVVERAKRGVYGMTRLERMPPNYLKRFCLRGKGDYADKLRVADEVRRKVTFGSYNLAYDQREIGTFDIIFLRNVLIYFSDETKQRVLERVLRRLRPGGVLFVGHAEPLAEQGLPLRRLGRALFERLA